MTISNLEHLKDLLETAQASYGKLTSNTTLRLDLQTDAASFSEVEAKKFVERYDLIDQQPNTNEGFSASLFYDKIDGKYVFAIRGTEVEDDVVNDLFNADLGDIRSYGYAADQAVDLYRYWKKLTSPSLATNLYSTAEINRLYLLNHPLLGLANIVYTAADYISFSQNLSLDTGLKELKGS